MTSRYLGSSEVLTSVQNEEIIPKAPERWTLDRYELYKLSFINYDPITVKINDGEPIFLDAEQGFECEKGDQVIKSFVILTENVRYSWIGAFE